MGTLKICRIGDMYLELPFPMPTRSETPHTQKELQRLEHPLPHNPWAWLADFRDAAEDVEADPLSSHSQPSDNSEERSS